MRINSSHMSKAVVVLLKKENMGERREGAG